MTKDARQIITSVEATRTSELICLQRTRARMSLVEGGEGERRLDLCKRHLMEKLALFNRLAFLINTDGESLYGYLSLFKQSFNTETERQMTYENGMHSKYPRNVNW